jgi:hypothetical protein
MAHAESTSPEAASGDRFRLQATYNSGSQLSRTEIDKSALGMGSLSAPRPEPRGAALIATASPRTNPPNQLQDDTPGAFMNEYNVDWSRWVSVEADKWFYILRSAETGFGIRFDCPRPALIQFTCYADGTVGNIILRQSSGVPVYDQLQIEALKATMPTNPFPPGTVRRSITLIQGWESHKKRDGEADFQPGSFGKDFPAERVRQWLKAH